MATALGLSAFDAPKTEASLEVVRQLTASDANTGAWLGFSAAIDADTAVIGARNEGLGAIRPGAAYVFERDEGGTGNWGQVTKLVSSDASTGDRLGGSVGVSGDTIVVGADGDDTMGFDAGAAYVFERNLGGPNNWGEVAKLVPSGGGPRFGLSSGISGDTIVIGARDEGAAYVFHRHTGGLNQWGEVAKLEVSGVSSGDQFGLGTAIDGDTVVVGANREGTDAPNAGAAYIFERNLGGSNNWGLAARLSNSNIRNGQLFGWSVGIAANTVVVGAYGDDERGTAAGAVHVFERNEGGLENWGKLAKLTAADAEPGDQLGISVGVHGDTVIAGANFQGEFNNGAAYIFNRHEGGPNSWGQVRKIIASSTNAHDEFGWSVGISGNTATVGAWRHDGDAADAGAAYILAETPPSVGGDALKTAAEIDPLRTAAPYSVTAALGVCLSLSVTFAAVAFIRKVWSSRRHG